MKKIKDNKPIENKDVIEMASPNTVRPGADNIFIAVPKNLFILLVAGVILIAAILFGKEILVPSVQTGTESVSSFLSEKEARRALNEKYSNLIYKIQNDKTLSGSKLSYTITSISREEAKVNGASVPQNGFFFRTKFYWAGDPLIRVADHYVYYNQSKHTWDIISAEREPEKG